MHGPTLAALVCLALAAGALLFGEASLAAERDLRALYWVVTAAVLAKACVAIARVRA